MSCAIFCFFFFCKQNTAYEMRISDWSSDVCSSDLKSGRRIVPVSIERVLEQGVSAVDGVLYENGKRVFALDFQALPGAHNGQNIAAAYAAGRAAGLAPATIRDGIAGFPGLKHRLLRAGIVDGIPCINDSKATNAESTARALASYPAIYWIAGGVPKAGGIASLAPFFPRISHASLIGQAAADFAATLGDAVPHAIRSAARRVGKECVSTGRYRWCPHL